jgi:hypothetical protein
MRRRHLLLGLALLPLAAAPAHSADKKKGGGLSFIQLPTITAAIVRADGRRGVLTVESGIDVPNEALRIQVERLQPRLRDAFASTLMIVGSQLRPGEPPDLDRLEARLQADTNRIVGRPGARLLLGATLVN